MNIRESARTGSWLLVAVIVVWVLAEITQILILQWLGAGLKVWLFLHLYWVGIGIMAYFSERNSKNAINEQVDTISDNSW